MIDCFEAVMSIRVINAAGCGHTLKEYHHILQDDPEYSARAKPLSPRLEMCKNFGQVGLTTPLHPLTEGNLPIVYQDACHLLHGQKDQPSAPAAARQIPGVTLRNPSMRPSAAAAPESTTCCTPTWPPS
jgi:glycolate oxidase iron-sulfur subunit